MAAYVDIDYGVVRSGDVSWPFDIDCRDDLARIDVDGRRYALRPLGWREKRSLARYVHLGENFLQDQFLRVSLADTGILPVKTEHRDALVALARWINAPDGNFGLPLDPQLLASVTLQVCRDMQLAPDAFDDLGAAEVEMLWQASRAQQNSVAAGEAAIANTAPIASADPAMTRIVVIDGTPRQSPARDIAPVEPAEIAQTATVTDRIDENTLHTAVEPAIEISRNKRMQVPVADRVATHRSGAPLTRQSPGRFRFNVVVPGNEERTLEPTQTVTPPVTVVETASEPAESRHDAISITRATHAIEPPAMMSPPAKIHALHTARIGESTQIGGIAIQSPASGHDDATTTDDWLAAFADRLDEAAKACGIDLES